MENTISVICIREPFCDSSSLKHLYSVGKVYTAKYYHDRCLLPNNDIVEYEWMVYCAKYNHYQFTDSDYRKYFMDVAVMRNEKINEIIND